MNRLHGLIARAALLLFILSAGCVSLERSYPEKRYFVVELGENMQQSNPVGEKTLLVSGLRISPRYADKSFVYRTSEAGYESDFYNQFLTSPETMLSEEVRKGLAASTAFKYVVGPSSQLQPNYVLEGSVNALYGDFRNLDKPAAVLEIEFFLHNEDSANPGIVLQKRYMKAVSLSGRSPEALVKGWSQALGAVLTELNTDLQKVKS
ncbi:MAG TPA: ABC-type transport auxiliary lipoprotein family protein [Verrucomicrobiae bacterium]|nr:ABC-type transport auxiliary lipoprotein family protein [Verrucomicrobiae bacterium]